jgi:hypothetical protein
MGHSDISVTMNVYTHIGFDDAEEELKRMEEFMTLWLMAGTLFLIYKIFQNIDIDNTILLKYNMFQKSA